MNTQARHERRLGFGLLSALSLAVLVQATVSAQSAPDNINSENVPDSAQSKLESQAKAALSKFNSLLKHKDKQVDNKEASSELSPHPQIKIDESASHVTTGSTKAQSSPKATAKSKESGHKQIVQSALNPDPAMVSILKDITKALDESEDVAKIEDPMQKAAVALAKEALHKAIDNPDLPSNRIIAPDEKAQADQSMVCEVWDSGEITVQPGCHASLSTLWAKKTNGLINLEIAGNCTGKKPVDGPNVGEFVFVISGKSTIENGFDIQTQTSANYWLGKLSSFAADAGSPRAVKADQPVATSLIIQGPLTQAKREALVQVKAQPSPQAVAVQTGAPQDGQVVAESDEPAGLPNPETLLPKMHSVKPPSLDAQIVLPDKAIAGQYLSACVVSQNHQLEKSVELAFNGVKVATGDDGRAQFMVPDDSTPGPTLQVALAARHDLGQATVHIFQPLVKATSQQTPRVDLVSPAVQKSGTITVDGHNFDGIASHNKVSIDGKLEARVLAASPMQLKVDVPSSLACGTHSLIIQTQGMASAPSSFDVVALEIEPGKQVGTSAQDKVIVRARGTSKPVELSLTNKSPSVIKIVKGNALKLRTTGGQDNSVVVVVQRLRKGNYHIQADLL